MHFAGPVNGSGYLHSQITTRVGKFDDRWPSLAYRWWENCLSGKSMVTCASLSAPIAPDVASEVVRWSCKFSRMISFSSSIEHYFGACPPSCLLVNQWRSKSWGGIMDLNVQSNSGLIDSKVLGCMFTYPQQREEWQQIWISFASEQREERFFTGSRRLSTPSEGVRL